uniref:Uncharacterized protein n=1 Tax=Mesocestoides corti TaxID=53468 RepID=A0A5K3F1L6_MESCO
SESHNSASCAFASSPTSCQGATTNGVSRPHASSTSHHRSVDGALHGQAQHPPMRRLVSPQNETKLRNWLRDTPDCGLLLPTPTSSQLGRLSLPQITQASLLTRH